VLVNRVVLRTFRRKESKGQEHEEKLGNLRITRSHNNFLRWRQKKCALRVLLSCVGSQQCKKISSLTTAL
jgi:hypothetical protein